MAISVDPFGGTVRLLFSMNLSLRMIVRRGILVDEIVGVGVLGCSGLLHSPSCGGGGSLGFSEFGARPTVLCANVDCSIIRLPPALEPEYPSALSSITAFLTFALHSWQAPM